MAVLRAAVPAAVAQVRLAARVRAAELALERRRIAQLHYGELMTTTTELLAARTVLAQARLGRIQAQRDVRVRLAQLELAIGGALEKETGEQH